MRPGGPVVSAEQRFGGRRRAPRGRGESRTPWIRRPSAPSRRDAPQPWRPPARRQGAGGGRQARPRGPGPLSASGGGSGPAKLLGIRNGCQWPVTWESTGSSKSCPAAPSRGRSGPRDSDGLGQSRDAASGRPKRRRRGPGARWLPYSEGWNSSSPRWRRSAIWYVCPSARDVGLCAAAKRARATSARRAAAGRAALSTAYWRNAPSSAW